MEAKHQMSLRRRDVRALSAEMLAKKKEIDETLREKAKEDINKKLHRTCDLHQGHPGSSVLLAARHNAARHGHLPGPPKSSPPPGDVASLSAASLPDVRPPSREAPGDLSKASRTWRERWR